MSREVGARRLHESNETLPNGGTKRPPISSARIPRATRATGMARYTATAAPHPAPERRPGPDPSDPPWPPPGVGQTGPERPPDPSHRLVRGRSEGRGWDGPGGALPASG